jgi:hypothetical protein
LAAAPWHDIPCHGMMSLRSMAEEQSYAQG